MSELNKLVFFEDESQEYDIHTEFAIISLNANSSYSKYYVEDEIVSMNEYIKKIQNNQFKNSRDICHVVQDFFLVSKYNLRRNNTSNRRVVTFVCECVSKKKMEKKIVERTYSTHSSKSLPYYDNIIGKSPNIFPAIKRYNRDGCKFRMKFCLDKTNTFFIYDKTSILDHNHPPKGSISCEEFKCTYKNTKFPLQMVISLFKEMINYKDNLDDVTLKNLKQSYIITYKLFEAKESRYKKTISNKLNQLLRFARANIVSLENKNTFKPTPEYSFFQSLVIKFLQKSASCYLRLDNIEELIKMMDIY